MSDWFKNQRINFIREMSFIYGYINREHLMRKFHISQPQASLDISEFMKDNPDYLKYNMSSKRYEYVRKG